MKNRLSSEWQSDSAHISPFIISGNVCGDRKWQRPTGEPCARRGPALLNNSLSMTFMVGVRWAEAKGGPLGGWVKASWGGGVKRASVCSQACGRHVFICFSKMFVYQSAANFQPPLKATFLFGFVSKYGVGGWGAGGVKKKAVSLDLK